MDACSVFLRAVSGRIVEKSHYLSTNTIPGMECDRQRNKKVKKGRNVKYEEGKKKN